MLNAFSDMYHRFSDDMSYLLYDHDALMLTNNPRLSNFRERPLSDVLEFALSSILYASEKCQSMGDTKSVSFLRKIARLVSWSHRNKPNNVDDTYINLKILFCALEHLVLCTCESRIVSEDSGISKSIRPLIIVNLECATIDLVDYITRLQKHLEDLLTPIPADPADTLTKIVKSANRAAFVSLNSVIYLSIAISRLQKHYPFMSFFTVSVPHCSIRSATHLARLFTSSTTGEFRECAARMALRKFINLFISVEKVRHHREIFSHEEVSALGDIPIMATSLFIDAAHSYLMKKQNRAQVAWNEWSTQETPFEPSFLMFNLLDAAFYLHFAVDHQKDIISGLKKKYPQELKAPASRTSVVITVLEDELTNLLSMQESFVGAVQKLSVLRTMMMSNSDTFAITLPSIAEDLLEDMLTIAKKMVQFRSENTFETLSGITRKVIGGVTKHILRIANILMPDRVLYTSAWGVGSPVFPGEVPEERDVYMSSIDIVGSLNVVIKNMESVVKEFTPVIEKQLIRVSLTTPHKKGICLSDEHIAAGVLNVVATVLAHKNSTFSSSLTQSTSAGKAQSPSNSKSNESSATEIPARNSSKLPQDRRLLSRWRHIARAIPCDYISNVPYHMLPGSNQPVPEIRRAAHIRSGYTQKNTTLIRFIQVASDGIGVFGNIDPSFPEDERLLPKVKTAFKPESSAVMQRKEDVESSKKEEAIVRFVRSILAAILFSSDGCSHLHLGVDTYLEALYPILGVFKIARLSSLVFTKKIDPVTVVEEISDDVSSNESEKSEEPQLTVESLCKIRSRIDRPWRLPNNNDLEKCRKYAVYLCRGDVIRRSLESSGCIGYQNGPDVEYPTRRSKSYLISPDGDNFSRSSREESCYRKREITKKRGLVEVDIASMVRKGSVISSIIEPRHDTYPFFTPRTRVAVSLTENLGRVGNQRKN